MEAFRSELKAFADAQDGFESCKLVYGEGKIGAHLMLIGEAPGEQETIQGRPFVGKAGKNLDEFLAMVGIDREELYVTNTVKIRPTRISKAGRTINRPPTQDEITRILPWLKREIALIQPENNVTHGNMQLKAL